MRSSAHQSAQQAISTLFLDTELDDRDLQAVARQLSATGLAIEELQRIYETEVAPACWQSLHAVPGGEWAGFDEAALQTAIDRHALRSSHPNIWQRWAIRRWTASTRQDWVRVVNLVTRAGA